MDLSTLKLLHFIIVNVFFISITIKTAMLLLGKLETLETWKKKTKVFEMVLGPLILVSGIILMFNVPVVQTWYYIKIALVGAAIPLAIVGLKKNKKPLALVAWVIFLGVFGYSEGQKHKKVAVDTSEVTATGEEGVLAKGKLIYDAAGSCNTCHGPNGENMLGEYSLQTSKLEKAEAISVITNGRPEKGMLPYKDKLSTEEIDQVATYIISLRK